LQIALLILAHKHCFHYLTYSKNIPDMIRLALLAALACAATAGYHYTPSAKAPAATAAQLGKLMAAKQAAIIQCSPDWSSINEDSLASQVGVLPGWGSYSWPISSPSDSARFYFNQGINMYYAFHIIEAMASFKKAQRFDTACAMLYWAEALAYGPNINDFTYAAAPDALAAANKAASLSSHCTAKEKALITAMAVRYASTGSNQQALNQQYTTAMQAVYTQYTNDADVAALYADAMMLQHPWNYWQHNGTAQPWTPAIVNVLEKTLAHHPAHPGSNHYYIHMMEASPNAAKALPSANRLGKLMPLVAHMVHMPSHIYIRTGHYQQGIDVNEQSVAGYQQYLQLYPAVQNNAPLYLYHNLHMLATCAMANSNYSSSARAAAACAQPLDTAFLSLAEPMGNYIQYMAATPLFNEVRFGKWQQVLQAPAPAAHHAYYTVLWHWARGMAYAGTRQLPQAQQSLQLMQLAMQQPGLAVTMEPFNSPLDAAKLAAAILNGCIARQQGDNGKAETFFTEAARLEDALIYTEPRDWLLPARQYLGALQLQMGKATDAELSFRDELRANPNNHWSLYGLYQSLLQQQKPAAATVKKQYLQAFAGADIPMGTIVY
jgi:hypothetical protein